MSKTEALNSKIKLISFLKPYWKYAILSPIGMAIEAIANRGVEKGDIRRVLRENCMKAFELAIS